MKCSVTTLPDSCGYGIIFDHGNGYEKDWSDVREDWVGGTSLRVAAFIDEPRCKRVYDWIKEKGEIVYQSKPEHNRNSGRLNFLVVFKV